MAALAKPGIRKGYTLLGCNRDGNNAFFVREDLRAMLPARTPEEAFAQGRFREARDASGALRFLAPADEASLLEGLPLVEV